MSIKNIYFNLLYHFINLSNQGMHQHTYRINLYLCIIQLFSVISEYILNDLCLVLIRTRTAQVSLPISHGVLLTFLCSNGIHLNSFRPTIYTNSLTLQVPLYT